MKLKILAIVALGSSASGAQCQRCPGRADRPGQQHHRRSLTDRLG